MRKAAWTSAGTGHQGHAGPPPRLRALSPDSPAQEVAATPAQRGGSLVACDGRLPRKRQLIKTLGGSIVCILSPAEKQLFTVCLLSSPWSLGEETQKRLFSGAQFSS